MFPTNSSPLDANNLYKSLIQQECGCVSFCIKYIRRIKENQIIGESNYVIVGAQSIIRLVVVAVALFLIPMNVSVEPTLIAIECFIQI